MDVHKEKIIRLSIKRTMNNLEKNNFGVSYVPDREGVISLLSSLVPENSVIGAGGSVTLKESGVTDFLRSGKFSYLDRYASALSREEVREVTRAHLASDIYFSSANALTERGEIYVVDGSNNRLGALLWGPAKVYVIVGQNKIVRNLSEAVNRVKTLAAPANAVRLSKDTHCSKTGICIAPKISDENLMAIPAGTCTNGICSSFLVLGHQNIPQRIHVIIVGEDLGY
ncbi:MAG: lactate utilization protein [Sphaerochaetaceae bacterium]|nr:lactate utilization protein [Sphaerochaetaceae bacterium]